MQFIAIHIYACANLPSLSRDRAQTQAYELIALVGRFLYVT